MEIKYGLLFFFFVVRFVNCSGNAIEPASFSWESTTTTGPKSEPTTLPYSKPSQEELYEIGLTCLEEVKLDRSVVDKVLATQDLPQENEKYKKFLACSYKKQRYLSSDGTTMLYDNIFKFLDDYYNTAELETLNHCKKIKNDDEGELCFQNLACILEALKNIDIQRENESRNITESNTI